MLVNIFDYIYPVYMANRITIVKVIENIALMSICTVNNFKQ